MRKMRNLTGMPVVMNGRKIGRLLHAELTEDLKALSGVWIDSGLKGTRYIPVESLEMIGSKAVSTDSAGMRRRCKPGFLIRRAVSTGGYRIGAVTGAEIDEITFAVEALELSCGFWDDFWQGRRRIRCYSVHPESGDVVLQDSADESSKEDDT